MKTIGPAYGAALESGVPSLVAQLDAELAAREADSGPGARARGRPSQTALWPGSSRSRSSTDVEAA